VVHLPVNVLEGDGPELAEHYKAGSYYPVFVVTDSLGRVINRWVGYTGAERFVNDFNRALSSLVTVEEREARLKTAPSLADARFLATYYYDTKDYLKSAATYRLLSGLPDNKIDYSFRAFEAMLEASWSGLIPFDSVLPAADAVMATVDKNPLNVARTAQLLARLARKTGNVERIEKYLNAGMTATGYRNDEQGKKLHRDLLADYALHIRHDTATALEIKYKDLGVGWENDPQRYFEYGEWCLERKIRLDEAESYVRKATEKATGDKFKARHLRVLADIVYARGRIDEAIALQKQAVDLDPTNAWYQQRLAEMRRH